MTANMLGVIERLLAKQMPCLVLVPPKRYLAAPGSTAKMLRQNCLFSTCVQKHL